MSSVDSRCGSAANRFHRLRASPGSPLPQAQPSVWKGSHWKIPQSAVPPCHALPATILARGISCRTIGHSAIGPFFPLQSGWAVFDDAASGEYPGPAVFGPGPAARAARRGYTSQSRGAPKAFFCRGIKCDSPTCAIVMGILCMLLNGIPGIRMRLGVLTSVHLAWQK